MRITLALLCLLFAPAAQAEERSPFADWIAVTRTLKSEGIDPVKVNWRIIEPLCLGLRNDAGGDNSDYNRCRYTHARNHQLHRANRASCTASARAQFPDVLAKPRTESYQAYDNEGHFQTLQRRSQAMTRHDLAASRTAAANDCMLGLGWNSPDDWALGKIDGR